jgi:hypothetical protein
MTEREQLIVRAVVDRLRQLGAPLLAEGWRPELVVFDPSELQRLPGYKVALVVSINSVPEP